MLSSYTIDKCKDKFWAILKGLPSAQVKSELQTAALLKPPKKRNTLEVGNVDFSNLLGTVLANTMSLESKDFELSQNGLTPANTKRILRIVAENSHCLPQLLVELTNLLDTLALAFEHRDQLLKNTVQHIEDVKVNLGQLDNKVKICGARVQCFDITVYLPTGLSSTTVRAVEHRSHKI